MQGVKLVDGIWEEEDDSFGSHTKFDSNSLEVRPIFPWTEKRTKGHFVICFSAFLLERTLEFKLQESEEKASPEEIWEALNSLNFAEVEIENQQFLIRIKGTELSNKILKLLKIKSPKNITLKKKYLYKPLEVMDVVTKYHIPN